MAYELRGNQPKLYNSIIEAWKQGYKNVLAVKPTGGGKTVVMSTIALNSGCDVCLIAHRKELVSQISRALAENGVYHNLMLPKNAIKSIIRIHVKKFGKSFYRASSRNMVASVDTLIRRTEQLQTWADSVGLWVIDEAHHVLTENKWGKAVSIFKNARGLGFTATPCRTDGKGLDGVFNKMVVGSHTRELIDMNLLTDYKIYTPASTIDVEKLKISASTGDYTRDSIAEEVKNSSLISQDGEVVGDVVASYLKLAAGKRGVTFAPTVEVATRIAQEFNRAGVRAEIVSANTPADMREDVLDKFSEGKILQLVNVDLFGEGFDLPAIEVVSMARPTMSYSLYIQQFGRALRILDGKSHAIIIDHVGNVFRFAAMGYGKPCSKQDWRLEGTEKRKKSEIKTVTIKACPQCTAVYERIFKECSECGYVDEPTIRRAPEFVDGDLSELDLDVLDLLKKEVAIVDMNEQEYMSHMISKHVPEIGRFAGLKRHKKQQEAQAILRDTMAYWAGVHKQNGLTYRQLDKLFYITYGMDVLTAQALKTTDAQNLTEKIIGELC